MKIDYDKICRMIERHSDKYGKIEEVLGDFKYIRDDEKISDEKRKKLNEEQRKSLDEWMEKYDYYPEYEEKWYEKNAPEIWDRVEYEASIEEESAEYTIDEANEMLEYVESLDEEYRREYYRDRI